MFSLEVSHLSGSGFTARNIALQNGFRCAWSQFKDKLSCPSSLGGWEPSCYLQITCVHTRHQNSLLKKRDSLNKNVSGRISAQKGQEVW